MKNGNSNRYKKTFRFLSVLKTNSLLHCAFSAEHNSTGSKKHSYNLFSSARRKHDVWITALIESCSTAELVELNLFAEPNLKVWVRRRVSAVILEFGAARQTSGQGLRKRRRQLKFVPLFAGSLANTTKSDNLDMKLHVSITVFNNLLVQAQKFLSQDLCVVQHSQTTLE